MTWDEYKKILYEACAEHIHSASLAADRYASAKTEQERQQAKIENKEHLAAHFAIQWALYKARALQIGEVNENERAN